MEKLVIAGRAPAGATEIMEIIGKDETIRRVKAAIEKLENL